MHNVIEMFTNILYICDLIKYAWEWLCMLTNLNTSLTNVDANTLTLIEKKSKNCKINKADFIHINLYHFLWCLYTSLPNIVSKNQIKSNRFLACSTWKPKHSCLQKKNRTKCRIKPIWVLEILKFYFGIYTQSTKISK